MKYSYSKHVHLLTAKQRYKIGPRIICSLHPEKLSPHTQNNCLLPLSLAQGSRIIDSEKRPPLTTHPYTLCVMYIHNRMRWPHAVSGTSADDLCTVVVRRVFSDAPVYTGGSCGVITHTLRTVYTDGFTTASFSKWIMQLPCARLPSTQNNLTPRKLSPNTHKIVSLHPGTILLLNPQDIWVSDTYICVHCMLFILNNV